MAKGKNRGRNKAIRNAAKDGRVTRKEARQLSKAGASASKIKSVASRAGATVSKNANSYLTAPKPTPTPTPTPTPSPTQSVSQQRSDRLSRAVGDGQVSVQEARQLAKLGIDQRAFAKEYPGVELSKEATRALRTADSNSRLNTTEESRAARRQANGNGRPAFTSKELETLRKDALGFSNTRSTGLRGRPGQYGGGADDYTAYSLEDAIKKGTNKKLWDKVGKTIGSNWNGPNDYADGVAYVLAGGGSGGGNGRGKGGGSNEKYDRSSGEFDDIVGALGEDAQAGLDAADDLANTNPSTGTTDAYTELLSDLEMQIGNLYDQSATNTQAVADASAIRISGLEAQLAQQGIDSANNLAMLNDAFANQITGLEGMMMTQQQEFQNTQALMEQELSAAQAALLDEQRRAANLALSYVPQANPNALSVSYGDGRRSTRRQQDNQLSDLSILTGLGTGGNPLAGLQLA